MSRRFFIQNKAAETPDYKFRGWNNQRPFPSVFVGNLNLLYNMKDTILPVKQDEWVYTTTKKSARTKAKRARSKAKRALSKKLLQNPLDDRE